MPDARATSVVLVDHGSRLDEANAVVERAAHVLRTRLGDAIVTVEPAHMELAEPSLAEAFDRCVAAGAVRVVVAQFFLAPGRHSVEDIPRLVAEALERHQGVEAVICEALGDDEGVIGALAARVAGVLRRER